MNDATRRALQVGLPVGFVGLGLVGVFAMTQLVRPAAPREVAPPAATVDVTVVAPRDVQAVVEGTGTVEASRRVDLVPQVQGRIVWVAEGLAPGSRLAKGQVIARVESADYEAAVVQARSNVEAARLELALEEARVQSVAREFELLGQDPGSALARREPQLQAARARLASAEAQLDQARLNVQRTTLTAPFDALVSTEALEVGQYVAPGAPVATLLGTDAFRVRAAVPVRQLAWLEVPQVEGLRGSPAVVRQAVGTGQVVQAEGWVSGRLGELDPQTRTAALLVTLDDPLAAGADLPILPGAYVDVTVHGRTVPGVFQVPRVAVVDGDDVFVADEDDRLRRKEITIAWGSRDHVHVTGGLSPGDRVVVTPLALPIEGMELTVRDTVAGTP